MTELKYRNEYKHIINKAQAVIIKSKLKVLLKSDEFADKNGEYFIRSLYFDTYDNKALAEKLDGVPLRYKYRIRFYNHDTNLIKLENKVKHFNSSVKFFCTVTKQEAEKILNGDYDFLKNSEEPLKRNVYQEFTGGGLVPKTVVDYIRTPFVYPHGNVRITIDSDIRSLFSQSGQADIFNPNIPTVSVFPDERCVLEVKYDEYIPEFIHKVIQTENSITSSMSKYAACRRFI
ncbi:MAG: polyphosphate polymerase domain-containing protein [Oscillospiraceae bacterium]|nr:polyphosphate polymerase domain-containing protein [Oscillospiraceae bacterium]